MATHTELGIPEFVKIHQTGLMWDPDRNMYWRINGNWGVEIKIVVNGVPFSKHIYKHINNVKLIAITEQEYLENEGNVSR